VRRLSAIDPVPVGTAAADFADERGSFLEGESPSLQIYLERGVLSLYPIASAFIRAIRGCS